MALLAKDSYLNIVKIFDLNFTDPVDFDRNMFLSPNLRLLGYGHREYLEPVLGGQVGEVLLLVKRQARRLALAHHDHSAPDAGAHGVQGLVG